MHRRVSTTSISIALVMVLVGGCRTAGPAHRQPPPGAADTTSPRQSDGDGRAARLLYVRGASLRTSGRGGRHRLVAKVPGPDVRAAHGTDLIAYVEGSGPRRGPDFLARPVLHVLDPSSEKDVVIGPGFGPMWAPGGSSLAYLEPIESRACDGEVCPGRTRVVAYDSKAGERSELLGPGRWSLLSWAGKNILVADASDLSTTLSVPVGAPPRRLRIAPSEMWDASPDGRWLVRSRAGEAAFLPLVDGRIDGAGIPIPVGPGILADGAWSPDSATVAAVLLHPGNGTGERLVIFSPTRPAPVPVAGSKGVVGNVVWGSDGSAVGFAAVRGRTGAVTARVCSVRGRECRSYLSSGAGVRLLRLE
jgi:hypothetical protein